MILSFSIETMRPMIVAGLRQRRGEDVGLERVKRQTIRTLGPRNKLLLERAKRANETTGAWALDYDLQCWWKSRTPERALLGQALGADGPITVEPITISRVQNVVQVDLLGATFDWVHCGGLAPDAAHALYADRNERFEGFSYADGFVSARAFVRFFVPNWGDEFKGALFKW